jgi:Na+-driven multidrug efflux pump
MCALIGAVAAAYPRAWLSLFDNDPAMLAAGTAYLQTVGPFYAFFGLGLGLYFAFQGFGRLRWAVLANFTRLAIAVGGGWLALQLTGDLRFVFVGTQRRIGCIRIDQRNGARNWCCYRRNGSA